nr:hypothetical protein L203_05012 [Cryptococcus depauperatus CBS 7841]
MPSKHLIARRSASSKRFKPSGRGERSIWTAKDDWESLISNSALSTSSISSRPPAFRGTLPSLSRYACSALVRGFGRVWGDAGEEGEEWRRWWTVGWRGVPDHLKEIVRDRVMDKWGGILSLQVIHELFTIPPTLYLPGELLQSVAKTTRLKPVIPPAASANLMTSLILTHSPSSTDVGLAGLIHFLPNLTVINLKGCSLAGEKTVETMIGRCFNLVKINLKETKVREKEVAALLDKFGRQLREFKIGAIVTFDNVNSTFGSQHYPYITHLSLPGNILNRPNFGNTNTTRFTGLGYPLPRATPSTTAIHWSTLDKTFPSLTHLNLPGLLVPPGTDISTTNLTLVKLSIGPRGPPVPIDTITSIIKTHQLTLCSLSLGNLYPTNATVSIQSSQWNDLIEAVSGCRSLEAFEWLADSRTNDSRCDASMEAYGGGLVSALFGHERLPMLKRVILQVPCPIELPLASNSLQPIETFEIPNANLANHQEFAKSLSFSTLRSLDLSGTTVDGTSSGKGQAVDKD